MTTQLSVNFAGSVGSAQPNEELGRANTNPWAPTQAVPPTVLKEAEATTPAEL